MPQKVTLLVFIFMIVLQSLSTVVVANQVHQDPPIHLELDHAHFQDDVLANEATHQDNSGHDNQDCHHCGHCHGSHSQWNTHSTNSSYQLVNFEHKYLYSHSNKQHISQNVYRPPIA